MHDKTTELRIESQVAADLGAMRRQMDHVFAWLLICEWLAGITTALTVSPFTWRDGLSIHIHIYAAVLLGGAAVLLPAYLAFNHAGSSLTRQAVAVGQMIWVAVFIHLMEGRIESHFMVFVSLAFLALYRDPKALLSGSLVVAVDHILRGLLWPRSVYGVDFVQPFRWMEHSAYVLLEVSVLMLAIRQNLQHLREIAARQVQLEDMNDFIANQIKLKTNELEQLAGIVRSSGLAIIGQDASGIVTSWNEAAVQLYGYSQAEMIGQSMTSLLPSSREQEECSVMEQLRNGVTSVHLETDRICKDGRLLDVSLTFSPVKNAEGELIGSSKVARDITQQKRSAARLQLEHSVANSIANAATFGQAVDLVLASVSQFLSCECAQLYRLVEGEPKLLASVGAGPDVTVPVSRQKQLNSAATFIPKTTEFPFDQVVVPMGSAEDKNSFMYFVSSGTVSYYLELGTTLDAIGYQLDQFEKRKSAEQELRHEKAMLSDFIDNAPVGLLWLAPDGTVRRANISAETLIGCSRDELESTNIKTLLEAEDWRTICSSVISGEALNDYETTLSCRDAREKDVSLSVSALMVDGHVRHIRCFMLDVTNRKEIERRMSEFYSMVSHELRSPLASIRGALGLIEGGLAGELSEKATKLINIARTSSDRLIRLINDILDLRKLEAGRLELSIETVNTVELVENAVDGLRGLADEASIKLELGSLCDQAALCDFDRVFQVLTNLISNAIKFSQKGQAVRISTDSNEKEIIFRVSDSGLGIPESEKHKLFCKFQQLDSSDQRPKEGTGLGLAISKAIVEQHGGTIGVDSSVGEGSTFWFTLPRQTVKSTETNYSEGSRTILIIEDNRELNEVLALMLSKDGFSTLSAFSLAESRHLVESSVLAAIIVDLNLPDGNGLDLLQELRQNPVHAELPIIVLTGSDDGQSDLRGLCVVDWIKKPFDQDRLRTSIQYAMRKKGIPRALVVEDDPNSKAVITSLLERMGIECHQAASCQQAISAYMETSPDLIILDVGLAEGDGFEVVEKLKQTRQDSVPLLVYTGRDLSKADRERLTLGMTRHLTKARSTEREFCLIVQELLNGLLKKTEVGV